MQYVGEPYANILGWDISTNLVGLSVLSSDGELEIVDYLDLRKIDGDNAKLDRFSIFVDDCSVYYDDHHALHVVEDRLAGFTHGFSNANTLMKLGAMNFACSWILSRTKNDVMKIHPSTVKSMVKREGLIIPKGSDKKQLTLDFVKKKEEVFSSFVSSPLNWNRNGKLQPYCFDVADSYIVARAGFLKDAQARKASGDQGLSRD